MAAPSTPPPPPSGSPSARISAASTEVDTPSPGGIDDDSVSISVRSVRVTTFAATSEREGRSRGSTSTARSSQLPRRPTLNEAVVAVKRDVRHRNVDFLEEMELNGQALGRALTYMKVGMPKPNLTGIADSGQPSDATCYERARDRVLAWFSRREVARVFLVLAVLMMLAIIGFGLLIVWVCLGLFLGVDTGSWSVMDEGCLNLAATYNQVREIALMASDGC